MSTKSEPRPWRSGFCNPSNPASSHAHCRGVNPAGKLCCCECHARIVMPDVSHFSVPGDLLADLVNAASLFDGLPMPVPGPRAVHPAVHAAAKALVDAAEAIPDRPLWIREDWQRWLNERAVAILAGAA